MRDTRYFLNLQNYLTEFKEKSMSLNQNNPAKDQDKYNPNKTQKPMKIENQKAPGKK